RREADVHAAEEQRYELVPGNAEHHVSLHDRRSRRRGSGELVIPEGGKPMITGAHAIIYSTNADADRAFLRDVLRFTHVDVGDGWLIFGLPPAEVAVHPSGENDTHELYLMCDDVAALVSEMSGLGIVCTMVENLGWGLRTQLTLPGGGRLGIYEPRHARPP